jgi:long-chain acyl-CoA synthetase
VAIALTDLTRPGGPFPLVERIVNGRAMQSYDRGPRTLRDVFFGGDIFSDRTAWVYEGRHWTFAEQRRIVIALAWALRREFDIRSGDRVAIAMRNYPEWPHVFWAIQLLGGVAVPLNAWLTGPELAELLCHAEPKLLFADGERLDRLHGALDGIAVVGVRSGDRAVRRFEDLAATPSPAGPPVCTIAPDDVATILYTSGTMAQPKGVVATHFNHCASLLNRYIRVVAGSIPDGAPSVEPPRELRPARVKVMAYPLFHIAGIGTMCAAAYNGHTLVTMYKWDVDEAVEIVEREKAAEVTGPPAVTRQIVEAGRRQAARLASLDLLACGGSAAPARMLGDIVETFAGRVTATTGYGSTETTGGVIAISGADLFERPDSVGRVLPLMEVKVVDPEGRDLPAGEPGELLVRGPQVMREYHHDPEATRQALRDGWFRSGDVATIDGEGFVRLVGRSKDMVIRGGENIACAQVEMCIEEHPGVIEAAALGVPHEGLGEELALIVRPSHGASLDGTSIREFLAARLAAFKVPAHVLIVSEPLPRTASGKLLKRDMKTLLDAIQSGDPEEEVKAR